jgi:16S rRNA (guanine966-N2)-methyltransferase
MRIIAGVAKGRRLVAPAGLGTRPMTDRVREALFSSLGAAVEGAAVLDLYAGSGSVGLEALSRGASSAVFVERNRKALDAVHRNIAAVRCGGSVVAGDVAAYLDGAADRFDLVFVDPPYELAATAVARVLGAVETRLEPGGIVVLHRRVGHGPEAAPAGLQLVDRRRYGDAELWRYVKEET